jgi:predicted RNA-binding protein with PUA-like domain
VSYFLAKTEPLVYSIDQFRSDLETTWDGVKNPQALQAVRAMRPDDRVFIYHSGGASAVVGLADVISDPAPDPSNPKSSVVRLRYVTHLSPPTTLAEIKASPLFADWALVRQSRLSTMKAPDEFVEWMRQRYPEVNI